MSFDAATVKEAARGRWIDLLVQLGIDSDYLRNLHGPCPGCGGKDRFRFDDQDGNGTFLCSQGGGGLLTGDGFTLLEHVKGWDFARCLSEVGRIVGAVSCDPPRDRSPPKPVEPNPTFAPNKLSRSAARCRAFVNAAWLADRSPVNPYRLSAAAFLRTLYRAGENVLVFTDRESQGQALWPNDKLPVSGPDGVWFLAQPVDGKYWENPRHLDKATRKPVFSRRSQESVAAWRFLVLESDEANPYDWTAALVQLPLAISAIYTSGRRSIHALVRVGASSLEQWRTFARSVQKVLVTLGADQQVLATAVRLTRLPGCLRGSRLQKLLYLNHEPEGRPILTLPRVRNILGPSIDRAQAIRRGAGDVIASAKAKDLNDCIAALDAHESLKASDPASAVELLKWFESAPDARSALGDFS